MGQKIIKQEQSEETTTVEETEDAVEETAEETVEETEDAVEETAEETVEETETEQDYGDLVERLKKTEDELAKFKHFNRKLEEDKKSLGLEVNKLKLAKTHNLPEESLDLITGKTAEEQAKQAQKIAKLTIAQTQNQNNRANPLQGITQDATLNLSTEGEVARKKFEELFNKRK